MDKDFADILDEVEQNHKLLFEKKILESVQSVQDGDLDRVSSDMKKVAPFIEQVKVLSQVFTEQDAAITEMKQSTPKSDEN